MWPSDGGEGRQEWSRRCRFNDPNCGGSPLRREEEREGSIVLILNFKLVVMIIGPQFQWLPIGYRWSLSHQDCQKTVLGFFLIGVSTQSEGVITLFA